MKRFEREVASFTTEEREITMGLVSSWEQKGIEQGKEDIITRLLRRRFGAITDAIAKRIDRLTSEQLSNLADDLLDFTSPTDLEQWLNRQQIAAH